MGEKQRFVIISDVHGFYNEMMDALNKVNFNSKTDFLVSLGDEIDRGPDPDKVIDYLMSLSKTIFIKGNHTSLFEECVKRHYPHDHDYSNGTFQTILDLAPHTKTFADACDVAYEKMKPFINSMVNYFETKNYIFVHSWIAVNNDDGLPYYYTRNRKFSFNPDWRNAHYSDWEAARWGNPYDMAARGLLPDKTVIFGHWHTSWPRYQYNGEPEWGKNADFGPYFGDGYIGIDACCAHSGKINVLTMEDEFLDE